FIEPATHPLSAYSTLFRSDRLPSCSMEGRCDHDTECFTHVTTRPQITVWAASLSEVNARPGSLAATPPCKTEGGLSVTSWQARRSEEHTSELQSRFDFVCR